MTDTVSVLVELLREGGARSVVDMGCGDGALAAILVAEGFAVTGIEPAPELVALARARVPGATFVAAGAEDRLEGAPAFDAGIFVNSLHHVAEAHMRGALMNTAAMIRPGGPLVVIEPLASGSFFNAMRPVEDETAIRAAAAATVAALVGEGKLRLEAERRWDRESRFPGPEAFAAHLARVDPARAELARANADALDRAWHENARPADGGGLLVQPMIAWVLSHAG